MCFLYCIFDFILVIRSVKSSLELGFYCVSFLFNGFTCFLRIIFHYIVLFAFDMKSLKVQIEYHVLVVVCKVDTQKNAIPL